MASTVSVNVTANTSQAQSAINQLKSQLSALSSQPININDKQLVEANKTAIELQKNLNAAMNPNTGKFDLGAFNNQLAKSGKSINDIYNGLQGYGAEGNKAFLSLAKTIASAEAPTTRLNKSLVSFGDTLKRTISWQLSSSMIHGAMSTFSRALSYTQQLNESLTNIRIVTGQNIDQMAKFAEEANKSAKALGTTTTAYTDASLIYYQQGLSDKAVKARTDVTIKLANAAGVSAEKASEQLTAIWNNFAKGSDNLEHYGDVLVKLGSETASSSNEISRGVQKFAAAGNTVGLSYEYAAAALATVTATTRESADTVGTAFRTLFSRLEGLKLGETLEDGTDVNKYSKALDTVGVKIKTASGEMRSMDSILMDLGNRWGDLTKDQQIALAQTVGGARQYTTLMALMNNFDTFRKNINRANNADGTLQKQQDIYVEGWEAASKRVKASMEDVFDSLIDDQAMIKVSDAFSSILDLVANVTDGFGGLGGILSGVAGIFMQHYAKEMPSVLSDIGLELQAVFNPKGYQDSIDKRINQVPKRLQEMRNKTTSRAQQAEIDGVEQQLRMNRAYQLQSRRMSARERADYETEMEIAQLASVKRQERGAKIDALAENIDEEMKAAEQDIFGSTNKNRQRLSEIDREQGRLEEYFTNPENNVNKKAENKYQGKIDDLNLEREKINDNIENVNKAFTELARIQGNKFTPQTNANELNRQEISQILNSYKNLVGKSGTERGLLERLNTFDKKNLSFNSPEKIKSFFTNFKQQLEAAHIDLEQEGSLLNAIIGDPNDPEIEQKIEKIKNKMTEVSNDTQQKVDEQRGYLEQTGAQGVEELTEVTEERARNQVQFDLDTPDTQNTPKHRGGSLSEKVTSIAGAATTTVTAIGQLTNAFDQIQEEGFNADNIISGLTAIGSTAFMVADAAQGINAAFATISTGLAAGVMVGILGAAVLAKDLYDWYDRTHENEEERRERLSNEYTSASQAVDDAKNSYEELNTAINSYGDAIKGLNELTRGTTEYATALEEANTQAEKLIKAGSLIYGKDYTVDKNGLKNINTSAKIQLEEDAKKAVQEAELSASAAEFTQEDNNKVTTYQKNVDETVQLLSNIGDLVNEFFGNTESQFQTQLDIETNQGTTLAKQFKEEDKGKIQKEVTDFLLALSDIEDIEDIEDKKAAVEKLVQSNYGSNLLAIAYEMGTKTGRFSNLAIPEQAFVGSFWGEYNQVFTDDMVSFLGQAGGNLGREILSDIQAIDNDAKANMESFMLEYAGQDGQVTLLDKAAANEVANEKYTQDTSKEIDEKSKYAIIGGSIYDLTEPDALKDLTLDELKGKYLSLDGISKYALNEILYGSEFVEADEQGRKEILAKKIKQQQQNNAYRKLFEQSLEDLQDDPYYKKFGEDFYQAGIADIAQAVIDNGGASTPILNTMATEWANTANSLYGLIYNNSNLISSGELGQNASDFATIMSMRNMSIETMEEIGQAGRNLLDTFGGKSFSNFISSIFKDDEYNESLLKTVKDLDFSDAITGLFDLKNVKDTVPDKLANDLNEIYNSAFEDLGGEGGLLNELFGIESFQSVLESLNEEFKSTGEISADAISNAADSCEVLNKYLKDGEHTAAQLAKAMTLINQNNLNPASLTDAFFEALKAGEQGVQLLQDSFNLIDGFTMPRSFQDVVDFYGNFWEVIKTAQSNGLVNDPTVKAAFNGMFGSTQVPFGIDGQIQSNSVYDEYAKKMAEWQNAGLSAGEIQANFKSWFSNEIALMEAVSSGKGIQSYFDYYAKKGMLENLGITYSPSDGTTSGGGYVYDRDENGEIIEGSKHLAQTQQELIDEMVFSGVDKNIATAMTNNMRYGNVDLDLTWGKGEAKQALDIYKQGLKEGEIVSQSEVDALWAQYGTYWKNSDGENNISNIDSLKSIITGSGAIILATDENSFKNKDNFETMLKNSGIEDVGDYLSNKGSNLTHEERRRAFKDVNDTGRWLNDLKYGTQVYDYERSKQALEEAGATSAEAMAILSESGQTFARTWVDSANKVHTEVQNADQTLEQFNTEVDQRIADDQNNHNIDLMLNALIEKGGIPLNIEGAEETLTTLNDFFDEPHSLNIDTKGIDQALSDIEDNHSWIKTGSNKEDGEKPSASGEETTAPPPETPGGIEVFVGPDGKLSFESIISPETEAMITSAGVGVSIFAETQLTAEERLNNMALDMWKAAQAASGEGDDDAVFAAMAKTGTLTIGDMVSRVLAQGDYGDATALTLDLGNGTRITLNADGQVNLTSSHPPELETYGTTEKGAAEDYVASGFTFDPGDIRNEQFGTAFVEKILSNPSNVNILGSSGSYLGEQFQMAKDMGTNFVAGIGGIMQTLMEKGVFTARQDGSYQFPDGTVINAEGVQIASTEGTTMTAEQFRQNFDSTSPQFVDFNAQLDKMGENAEVTVKVHPETGEFFAEIKGDGEESVTVPVIYKKESQEPATDQPAGVHYYLASQEAPKAMGAPAAGSAPTSGPQVSLAKGGYIPAHAESGSINNILEGGTTFTGEEGPEIVWNKEKGYAYVAGKKRPEFVFLRPGDRVFNAKETRSIFTKNGTVQREFPGMAYSGGVVPAKYEGTTSNPIFNWDSKDKEDIIKGALGGKGGPGEDNWKPERYHYILNVVKQLEREFERLDKIKDRTFGQQKVNAIEAETKALEDQIDANKKYMDEIKEWEQYDINELQKYGVWDEIEFDENGFISNYAELDAKYGAQAANNKDDKTAGKIMEALKQLEETRELWKDAIDKEWDLMVQYLDTKLEAIDAEVEFKIDISDSNMDYLDFLLKQLDDDAYDAAEAIGVISKQVDTYQSNIRTYKEGISDIFALHEIEDAATEIGRLLTMSADEQEKYLISAGMSADEIEKIRDYMKSIMDDTEKMADAEDKVFERLSKTFKVWQDKINDQMSLFDHYNTVLTNVKNIAGLLNTKLSPDVKALLNQANTAMMSNAQNNVNASKKVLDSMINQLNDVQKELEIARATGDKDLITRLEEREKEINDAVKKSQEDYLNNLQSMLETAGQILADEAEQATEVFEKALSPLYGSIEFLSEAYERQEDITDTYLQDYERLYELSKLNRDLSASINDTDNLTYQKKLRDMQEEVNKLKADGVKLSEYDVDILHKRYELELARQALDEARESKTLVRLSRGADGNFGYVYTADEDEVSKAEQEYEDKFKALQEASDKYINDLQGKLISLEQEVKNSLLEIASNTELSEEEKNAQIELITNQYKEQGQALTNELNKALDNAKETYLPMLDIYKEGNAEFVDSFNETNLSLLTGIETIDDLNKAMFGEGSFGAMMNGLTQAMDKYNGVINQIDGKELSDYINSVKDVSMEVVDEFDEEFDKALDSVINFEDQYHTSIQNSIEDTKNYISVINDLIATLMQIDATADPELVQAGLAYRVAWSRYEEAIKKGLTDADKEAWAKAQEDWNIAMERYNNPNSHPVEEMKPTVEAGTYPGLLDGSGGPIKATKAWFNNWYKGTQAYKDIQAEGKITDERKIWEEIARRNGFALGFDTGGYTGRWGDYGKLAMLHEKELVLNQDDTKNFLDAIQIVRTISLNAQTLESTLSNLVSASIGHSNGELQQNIHIEAQFPNAVYHDEIQEAFSNLVNEAAQYARRS